MKIKMANPKLVHQKLTMKKRILWKRHGDNTMKTIQFILIVYLVAKQSGLLDFVLTLS